MPEPLFADRLAHVRARIAEAQGAGGWSHPVRIVAVTKTHGPEAVRTAAGAGLDAVGENRVQEALAKQEECPDVAVDWHLIGSLQTNKARQVAGRFALIHSVDRIELATELARRSVGSQAILVQVNCSGESQKGGVEPAMLEPLLARVFAIQELEVRGLMTMAELSESDAVQRRAFALLRDTRDRMQQRGFALPELSMGMSGDFEAAVSEGATMVRLGTVLFGERE